MTDIIYEHKILNNTNCIFCYWENGTLCAIQKRHSTSRNPLVIEPSSKLLYRPVLVRLEDDNNVYDPYVRSYIKKQLPEALSYMTNNIPPCSMYLALKEKFLEQEKDTYELVKNKPIKSHKYNLQEIKI